MRTAMLLTPTLEEVRLAAAKMGLPDREAQKFWNYYESQGWKVGKVRMVAFVNALAGWKLRYEERAGYGANGEAPATAPLSGADKMIYRDEYNRIVARIVEIRAMYDSHVEMSQSHRDEIRRIKARQEVLRKMLGIVV